MLDNASQPADYAQLVADQATIPGVTVIRSETNLGFAAGSNRLIDEALKDARCGRVFLLNSDAVADAAGVARCLQEMAAQAHDLMGGRMMKPAAKGERATVVDSLGISLYKSLLASNRKSTGDAYLGPTGGCAVYARAFLERMKAAHGYVFDPSYFCYAEDTDLCVRARLLGCSAGYVDEVVAYHEGQGSTDGSYNDFILYHGIRNSIWMMAKSIPGWIIAAHLPWVIALHAGIVVRHTLQRRFVTVMRLYGDAIAGLPRVLRERRLVQRSRTVPLSQFRSHIDRQFYERAFVKGAVRDLYRRG